ncbi:MAG: Hpt domain-containing protein [bacterium]
MSDAQSAMQNEMLDTLLSDFLDESDQLLAQLNENMLQLDEWVQSLGDGDAQSFDAELLNEMFRAAHSIKGLSAMLGLNDINTLTHKIENVFDAARNEQLRINGDVVDLIFMGLDRLTNLIELLKEPDGESVDCQTVLEAIRELLRSAGAERKQASQSEAEAAFNTDETPAEPPQVQLPEDPLKDIVDEKDTPDKYLSIFIDEAEQSLDNLSGGLLALEEGKEVDLRNPLATAHKLKGAAASIGLNRAAKLAHLMEDLLEGLVQSDGVLPGDTADLLLTCTDALQQYVVDLRNGPADSEIFGLLGQQLLHVKEGGTASDVHAQSSQTGQPSPRSASLLENLETILAEMRKRLRALDRDAIVQQWDVPATTVQGLLGGENVDLNGIKAIATGLDKITAENDSRLDAANGPTAENATTDNTARKTDSGDTDTTDEENAQPASYQGHVQFDAGLKASSLKAELIHEKLSQLGQVTDCEPAMSDLETLDHVETFRFRLLSSESRETITAAIRVTGVTEIALRPANAGTEISGQCHEPEPVDTAQNEATAASKPTSRSSDPKTETSTSSKQHERSPVASSAKHEASSAQSDAANNSAYTSESSRPENRQRGGDNAKRPAETVRVDIDRLDRLMDLTGQLVINKAQFIQIGQKLTTLLDSKQSLLTFNKVASELSKLEGDERRLDDRHAADELQQLRGTVRRVRNHLDPLREELDSLTEARDATRNLGEVIHQLERVSNGLQQGVMDTRMVPVGPLFTRFRRVVRDITRANGKQVQLVINGEKTELDKRMIDELGDPLVHMVRNSADHGIELPRDREGAGKPPQGTITLDACHRGNSIVIQVSDDGKGLDTDRIAQKCVDKGILTAADVERMTTQQLNQMIWEPGMTTAEKVTDVSGRGMGMDIVKAKIEELNGTVDLESIAHKGTTFTIKLPLTLAILPSLMVEIGGDAFAMPLEAVVEIVSVGKQHLAAVHGKRTAQVRGRVISVVQLEDAFTFHRSMSQTGHSQDESETVLVILGESGREIGLVVDRVVGEEDIVIKSIAENYKNIDGIAGASILGDGRVSLILDTTSLIDVASRNQTVGGG